MKDNQEFTVSVKGIILANLLKVKGRRGAKQLTPIADNIYKDIMNIVQDAWLVGMIFGKEGNKAGRILEKRIEESPRILRACRVLVDCGIIKMGKEKVSWFERISEKIRSKK